MCCVHMCGWKCVHMCVVCVCDCGGGWVVVHLIGCEKGGEGCNDSIREHKLNLPNAMIIMIILYDNLDNEDNNYNQHLLL